VFFVSYLLNIYDCPKPKVKNYKTILVAGAIAVGLYLFLHRKKIMPMTHPSQWRDMTPAQRAAYTRRMTLTTMAEKIKALKEARKQKSADENTPIGETKLTPEERERVLRELELRKEAEEEQGTGFDFIRERNPPTPAVPVEKRKYASILKSAERLKEEKRRREEKIAAELEEESRKQIETQVAYKNELLKNIKPKDQQGYSKKKTTEDVLKDLGLWALPRTEVKHTQEPEEEPKKQKSTGNVLKDYVEQQKKSKDQQGYSKKKTTEDVLKDLGLWALP